MPSFRFFFIVLNYDNLTKITRTSKGKESDREEDPFLLVLSNRTYDGIQCHCSFKCRRRRLQRRERDRETEGNQMRIHTHTTVDQRRKRDEFITVERRGIGCRARA